MDDDLKNALGLNGGDQPKQKNSHSGGEVATLGKYATLTGIALVIGSIFVDDGKYQRITDFQFVMENAGFSRKFAHHLNFFELDGLDLALRVGTLLSGVVWLTAVRLGRRTVTAQGQSNVTEVPRPTYVRGDIASFGNTTFYIRRNGKPDIIGPFDALTLQAKLNSGELHAADSAVEAVGQSHGKLKGMAESEWKPLNEMFAETR